MYPQASPISSKNPRKGGNGFGGARVFEVGAVCRVLSLVRRGYDMVDTKRSVTESRRSDVRHTGVQVVLDLCRKIEAVLDPRDEAGR